MAITSLCSSIIKILLFALSILAQMSVSCSLSDDISESHSLVGRNLLQAQKACPVSFEFENYTIITSQCKGPNYPAGPCCKAFKEFACPFVDELNDISNICSETMFSYITLIGNYTADLFGSICVEGKDGLDCSEFLPPEPDDTTSGAGATHNTHQLLVFTTSFLVPLLSML